VLVVDEALAVGDELFQKKCYAHLERLKEKGTSILLVTHSSAQIMQHCDMALLLHNGKARLMAEPAKIVVCYQRITNSSDSEIDILLSSSGEAFGNQPEGQRVIAKEKESSHLEDFSKESINEDSNKDGKEVAHQAFFDPNLKPQSTEIYPAHGGEIIDAWLENSSGERVNVLPFGECFKLIFEYQSHKPLENIAMTCFIASHTGQGITGQSYPPMVGQRKKNNIAIVGPSKKWRTIYSFNGGLWPGIYLISGALLSFSTGSKQFVHRVIDYKAIRILDRNEITPLGACALSQDLAITTATNAE
jgi:lipopolysaccharide transport system ATP-binding protein